MKSLLQDIRYGLRMLRKTPGFTAVAIITLALGIGANTAIFSLINAVMLRTLPVRDPQSLVQLIWVSRGIGTFSGSFNSGGCLEPKGAFRDTYCMFSYPMFEQMKAEQKVFSGVFASVPVDLAMNFAGRTSRLQGLFVSGNFFTTLGAQPFLGRSLIPADDTDAAAPVVVISYRFWKAVLGGDPAVVGKLIWAGKASATVVGVTAPGFLDLDPGVPTDFWVPLSLQPVLAPYFPKRNTASPWLRLMARLKSGVSRSRAAASASVIFAAGTTNGSDANFKPTDAPQIQLPVASRGLASLRQEYSRPLWALLVAVAAVLFLACVNLAGLLLSRSSARRKEVAMRSALGASRLRIIRQLLTDSLLLSVAGGVAGIVLGYWGADALAAFLSWNRYARLELDVHPDWHVLSFTLLISVLVGLLSGIVPALRGGQIELVAALKETNASSGPSSRGRWLTLSNGLVVAQMALAMLVLAGAGLLVRTLANLRGVNTGFDPQNLVIFGVDTSLSSRTSEDLKNTGAELQGELSALPGVTSVSYSWYPLLRGSNWEYGVTGGSAKSMIDTHWLPIAPNFFKTMRMPLLAGRALNAQDSQTQKIMDERGSCDLSSCAFPTAVINDSLAHILFGNQNPVGQHFRPWGTKSDTEVVGVVRDAKYDWLRSDVEPTVYVPIVYNPQLNELGTYEVRTAINPKAMMPEIHAAISRFDSNLLITDMKTQVEQIDQNIYQERLFANLSSLFALLALIVACVGVYGLLSHQVTRRTQEIGIRLALGAQRGDVLSLVIRQGAMLAILGATIGIAAALAVTRYLQSFLFGVKPSDPLTIVAVAFGLIAVALLASYIPARRAMKTDPMVALRYE